MLVILRFTYQRNRPIELDDSDVSVVTAFGERVNISWDNIEKIQCIRQLKSGKYFGWRYGCRIMVTGEDREINIEDTINDFPSLLQSINAKFKVFKIPLFLVDKGEDTLRRIKETPGDKAQRKKLVSEGLKKSIPELNPIL